MAGHGAPDTRITPIEQPTKIAIIAAQWHDQLMTQLVESAKRCAADATVDADVVRVPGSFELPVVAAALADTYDALVVLGVVIRGGTPHFDYVCQGVTQGITQVSVTTATPIGFGVLTCDTEEQAFDRAGGPGAKEDKGYEATAAALQTLQALRTVKA
ncbi:6,7-dimethyl-8-ribityllumazine synthase [Jonesia denitrificans]|uniref:6,7-dimethyl-8-ribityllumazine synthase n=1 Tax=Jonesia denitrificans (strain ATCC 14870 / DSM 20603 / BCRC 15368 / CIP 55.134 / JCM 11481 / NBRC 15587 / NCTC 10816 / Prevot 55134) TaxID=471856 RepID=C7R1D2_JONDD|nr:6,7-dimethyl-8-ribityllumazine synthase [Jonesia denitrificans]ACV08347.1 6,7-dimethyl-8-ribityllumazine synthase [Jonesia denitrificans DSM 20603]ASE07993.1 6,7-dimethyl-8-ribityllumazine synthase [Jonesia denitrificans]QXB42602.1 6,7-dimethyl-8-ribityllumazine synthase [Jonesia denitrificans]SQH20327.1 6,7-dimethyl-8-ribityllumazine synthase [Jonesia denitrificans]